jgi:hypothetical protein
MRLTLLGLLLLLAHTPCVCQDLASLSSWQEAALKEALRDPSSRSGAPDFVAIRGAPRDLWPELVRTVEADMPTGHDPESAALYVSQAEEVTKAALALAYSGAREHLAAVRHRLLEISASGAFEDEIVLTLN